MRQWTGAMAAVAGIALATGSLRAQSLSSFGMPGGGVSTIGTGAQSIVNTPINTSTAIAAFPGQQQPGFLASLFPGLHVPSFLGIGQSNYPSPSSFPSTQYPNFIARPFVPANNVPRYLLPDGYTPSILSGR